MVYRLNSQDDKFEDQFAAFLRADRSDDRDLRNIVGGIIEYVRRLGDQALFEYTEKYDRFDLKAAGLRFSDQEIDDAVSRCDAETLDALALAADRIKTYHNQQLPDAKGHFKDGTGAELGFRWTAVKAAGLYVPGGLASYPSSVLMNAIPAKVAGVSRLVMVVPTPDGQVNPFVLAAAKMAGVDEIYRIGGAQAVAALAHGTETIAPVDIIVGPGNAYVAEAKRQVFGKVGIDMIAGPSEILVVADNQNDPAWIAADLLSQAEHDSDAQSILITDDANFAEAVEQAIETTLNNLPRQDIARQSWQAHGAIIQVPSIAKDAGALIDRIAPEHLELALEDPDGLLPEFSNAGAIFMGRYTPEAVGDYVAGPNHVLPTERSARFSSGLSVLTFMKRSTITRCTPESLAEIGPAALRLAQEEGLDAHGLSVAIRLNRPWLRDDD